MDDPLDAERRRAEDRVAKVLYRHWAKQFDLLKAQLEEVRVELLAAQQMAAEQQPLRVKQAIDVTLDWGEEEAALQADLGTLLDELVAGAVATMQARYRRMGVKLSWEQWDAQAAEWARQYRYTLIKDLTDSTRKQLGKTISDWIATEADFADLVTQVRRIVPPNELPMIRDRARLVAQTETTRVYAESRMMGMQEAGLTHMVWQTANDELVCFPGSTLVTTDGGVEPIRKVRPGMRVFTRDGWKPVIATRKRSYSGAMVEITTDLGKVTATADHPFWTLECGWLPGRKIHAGYRLESVNKQAIQVLGVRHFFVGNAQDAPAVRHQIPVLALVPFGVTVPEYSIHLEGDTEIWQQVVNAIAAYRGLLDVAGSEGVKGLPDKTLRLAFRGGAHVASKGAKLPSHIARLNAKLLTALVARHGDGWSAAGLRAVRAGIALFVDSKLPATSQTSSGLHIDGAAFPTAHGVAAGHSGANRKRLTANRTDLRDELGGVGLGIAGAATETSASSNLASAASDELPADRTWKAMPGAGRGMVALVGAIAPWTAGRGLERVATVLAYKVKWHGAQLLTDLETVYHKMSGTAMSVYNLEVEGAPEFYANGVLVHNCPWCRPLNGLEGTINAGVVNPESGQAYKPPAHPGCRCFLHESTDEMMGLVQQFVGPEDGAND